MTLLHALILGIVQGLTEFIPISSSGHLVIFPLILKWSEQPLFFDTTLHLGTAAALVIYFYKDLINLFTCFIKDVISRKHFSKFSENGKLALYIAIGSVPAGILGLLFEKVFESYFRSILSVAIFLTLGTVLMFLGERHYLKRKERNLNLSGSIIIGFFQALALFPGVSRSGASISGGMILGLDREKAARFSFLLSVPIVVMAGVFKLISSYSLFAVESKLNLFTGFVASFAVGLLCINFLMKFLKNNNLYPFIIYRLILVAFLLTLSFRAL